MIRTDGGGARHFAADALGSTIALTDNAGAVQASYTYAPFGATSIVGIPGSNPFGYTGREDDGTGLKYYRARYYHPGLQRFISEDPIGLNGGINTYAYAWGNPLRFRDPLGLRPLSACEKDALSKYFPEDDLNRADLREAFPWWLFPVPDSFDAITFYDTIYFRRGAYNGGTPGGLARLGHEMVHVGQYASGMTYWKYITAGDHIFDYKNNPYEIAAYAIDDMIAKELEATGTACPPPSNSSKSSSGFK